MRSLILITSLFALWACNDKDAGDSGVGPADDTAGSDDTSSTGDDTGSTGDDTGAGDDTGVTPDPKYLELTVKDFLTGQYLEGVEYSMGDQVVYTDASGEASVEIETWAPYEIAAKLEGYHDEHLFGYNDDGSGSNSPLMISYEASALLGSLLGIPLDAADGLLSVGVYVPTDDAGGITTAGGSTVTIDAPHDVSLVQDSSTAYGIDVGDTTVDGTVIFANVAAGPVNVSATPPEGYSSCRIFPGEEAAMEITVYPNAMSRLYFVCDP